MVYPLPSSHVNMQFFGNKMPFHSVKFSNFIQFLYQILLQHCDQNTWEQLKGKNYWVSSWFQRCQSIVAGSRAVCVVAGQEVERDRHGLGTSYPQWHGPPWRAFSSEAPPPPKTAPPTRDQVSNTRACGEHFICKPQ
jgi:hypothetical protein